MELVEKISGLNGPMKKELVIQCVRTIVDETNIAGSYESFILPLLPDLIDKIVYVDHGKLKINTSIRSRLHSFIKNIQGPCL